MTLAAPAPDRDAWLTFAALAAAAAVAQRMIIPIGRHQGFPLAIVFLVAAALLLPPQLVALMGVAQHLPDFVGKRFPVHITLFNAANYTLNALAAWGAAELVRQTALGADLRWATAAIAAAVALVVLNHLDLAVMLRLARGRSLRASGLLAPGALLADFALAGLGVVFARFWLSNAYLLPLAIASLLLIHRSFRLVAQLGESEDRFRALFESAPVGTALIDLDARIVSSNRSLEQLLGYRGAELVGRSFRELLAEDGTPDRDADAADPLSDLLAGERERFSAERRLRRKDGTTALGQVALALARDAQRRPHFGIAMFEDLTERRQLEEQLRHAQKMEAVGQLAGGIAHDFNNLLTIILGRTRYALRLIGRNNPLSGDLDEIATAADRAAALTQQLLAFGRRQVLRPRVLDPNAVVTSTTGMLRRLIGQDIEIVVDLAPDLGHVRADPGQLEQVIINLAVNARDAMPGGGRLTIRTADVEVDESVDADHAPVSGEYVLISVGDTGHGMDAETRSHIFEPFFTTKEPGKGTGLGLATVHGIVGQSAGYVRVESTPGAGSTFAVYLPRAFGVATPHDRPPAPTGMLTGCESVLLVEDDDGVRALVGLLLSEAGYSVLVARDGKEALRLAERHQDPIDLLLTDLVMPGLGGAELADAVAPLRPGIRVLYISGYAGEAPAGVGSVVPKPFTEETLLRMVRQALDSPVSAAPAQTPARAPAG